MPKHNNIGYYLWVLFIGLVGRISGQLFHLLGVHWIGLDQSHIFPSQKVNHGFRIRSRRFKADHNLFQAAFLLKPNESDPKGLKSISQIEEGKRFNILTVRCPEIAVVHLFPNVDGCYQRLPVDLSELLCFILSHGYAPPLICVNQLAIGSNQSEYSRFPLNARLTAI